MVAAVIVLAACTPVKSSGEKPPAASPSVTPSATADPQDEAFIADLLPRLDSDPQIAQMMIDAMGKEQLIEVGRQDCELIAAGQYEEASNLKGIDQPRFSVWKTLNPFTSLIPSSLAVYCPDQTAGFNTWATTPAGPQTPLSDTATIKVTSNKPIASTITYTTWSGVQQANSQTLPWSTTALVPHGDLTGVQLAVSAQTDSGDADTTITCAIDVAGTVKAQNTSTGAYSVVNCSL